MCQPDRGKPVKKGQQRPVQGQEVMLDLLKIL